VRQRVGSGSAGERPISWPPLVVVESGEKGARIVSGGYGRSGRLDSSIVEGGGRGGDEYNSNGLTPSSMFPSVPRTILEEDEDEDDSSDLDFY